MDDQLPPADDLKTQGNALHKAIDFGFQVQAFLDSDIGKYLIRRAEDQVDTAVAELKEVNPFAPEDVRKIQGRIWVAESIQYWLAEALQAGYAAQDELIDQSL